MTHNLDGMVVVASGLPAAVTRWSGLLRKAAIQFAVTESMAEGGVGLPTHSEIWVEDDDAEKARRVLMKQEKGDRSLMW